MCTLALFITWYKDGSWPDKYFKASALNDESWALIN